MCFDPNTIAQFDKTGDGAMSWCDAMNENGDKRIAFNPLVSTYKIAFHKLKVQQIGLNLCSENPTIFAPKAIAISKSPVCTTSSPDITILMSVDLSMPTIIFLQGKLF